MLQTKKVEPREMGEFSKKWHDFRKRVHLSQILGSILLGFLIFSITVKVSNYDRVTGSAQWVDTNGQKYLSVTATDNYNLGYLEGEKLALKIVSLKVIITFMASGFNTNYKDIVEKAQNYIPFIPEEHLDEMRGMARGASHALGLIISFNDILIQNTFIDILYGDVIPGDPGVMGCTVVAADNDAEAPTYGQNYDFPSAISGCMSFVLHKIEGRPAVFGIKMGASLNYPTGKNENGVSVMFTVVSENVQSNVAIPLTSRTRLALEGASTAAEFKTLFFDNYDEHPAGGITVTMVDENQIISIDSMPTDLIVTYPETVVKSNTYVDSTWQQYLIRGDYSKDRQTTGETLLSGYYGDGILSGTELLNILKDPIICQKKVGDSSVDTLGFFTTEGFGLGYTDSVNVGVVPI